MSLHEDTMSLDGMTGKASGVTLVCHNYHYDVVGSTTCSTEGVSEAACLAAVQHLLPEGIVQGRLQLVTGNWGWVPSGCSVQSGGDWAAHYNRNSDGRNIGGHYTLVCVNSASSEDQCVGYYQAETATIVGGQVHEATDSAAHYGFSGESFVDFVNPNDDYVEWSVQSCAGGPAVLSFRYSLVGADRPLRVLVNDQEESASLSFPETGAWNDWEVSSVFANLHAGTNVIRLEVTGSSGPNLDALLITGA